MASSDYKGPRTFTNKVGTYTYEIWYSRFAKQFAVIVTSSNGARNSIGYVDSYLDGELLFHDWLANNEKLSSE